MQRATTDASPPTVVLDTSSLLTLMLAGEEHQKHYGYARLLMGMAKRGVIRLSTTDMVLGEFFGLQTPIQREDLCGDPPRVSAANIRYGYRFADQRVGFMRDLLGMGLIEIIPTRCGEEYLDRLHTILQHPSNDHIAVRWQSRERGTWPPSKGQLIASLLKPNTQLARAVHAHNLASSSLHADGSIESTALKNGFKDRGEISLSDAIHTLHTRGDTSPIFVLYEGGDVRGRVIQRHHYRTANQHDPHYAQYAGELDDRFNPNSKHFLASTSDGMGNVNFVTTYAFLHGLMLMAKTHGHFIVQPKECDSSGNSFLAYKSLMKKVGEKGLPRAYNRYRDARASSLGDELSQSPAKSLAPASGPWVQFLHNCSQSEEKAAAFRDVFCHFERYRAQQTRMNIDHEFEAVLASLGKLPGEHALPVIESMIHDLGRLRDFIAAQQASRGV